AETVEGRLKSDEKFRESLAFSLDFINIRVGEFQSNAEIAVGAAMGIKELAPISEKMVKLVGIAVSANKASEKAIEMLPLFVEESERVNVITYEALSNNALLSYLLLDDVKGIAQEFVEEVDGYINQNRNYNKLLGFARDLWVGYGISDALYNNDREMLKYWEKKGYLTTKIMCDHFLEIVTPEQLENIMDGVHFATVVAKDNKELMAGVKRPTITFPKMDEGLERELNEKLDEFYANRLKNNVFTNNGGLENMVQENIIQNGTSFVSAGIVRER
ncbi:MAG: hypothetical protein ACRC8J_01690, partial [Phocaeicola sp.]